MLSQLVTASGGNAQRMADTLQAEMRLDAMRRLRRNPSEAKAWGDAIALVVRAQAKNRGVVTASNVCLVISMYVCLYLVSTVRSDAAGFGAKRCGAERRKRSGAMTMRRSVATSLASTNAIQKCLPFNKRVIIFDHFEA